MTYCRNGRGFEAWHFYWIPTSPSICATEMK
jgi:hypothetical protein